MKMRRMKLVEMCLLVVFMIILLASILFALVIKMPSVSLVLLLVDFPLAGTIAVFASLSIREEEEEKSQFST